MDNNGIVAINTLINNVVTALEYSSTETGTVTDISLAANGIYGVSINNISYQAYSSMKDLKLQDRVLIVKSNTGTSQTRIISCKVNETDDDLVQSLDNVTFFTTQEKIINTPEIDLYEKYKDGNEYKDLYSLIENNPNFISDFIKYKTKTGNLTSFNKYGLDLLDRTKNIFGIAIAFTKATILNRIYNSINIDISDINDKGLKNFLEENVPLEIESNIRNSFQIINENEYLKPSFKILGTYLEFLAKKYKNELTPQLTSLWLSSWISFKTANEKFDSGLTQYRKLVDLVEDEYDFQNNNFYNLQNLLDNNAIQQVIIPNICNSENLILDFTCNYFLDISKISTMKIQPEFYLCIEFYNNDNGNLELIKDSHIEMPLFENTYGNVMDQTIIPNVFNKQIIIKKDWIKNKNYMTVFFKVVLTQQDQLIYVNDIYNKLSQEININNIDNEAKRKIANYLDWPSISFWATDYMFKFGLLSNISNLIIYPAIMPERDMTKDDHPWKENSGNIDGDVLSFLKNSYVYFDEERKNKYAFYCDFFEKDQQDNSLLNYQSFQSDDDYEVYFYMSLDDGEFKKVSNYSSKKFESDFFSLIPLIDSNNKELKRSKIILFYPYGNKKYESNSNDTPSMIELPNDIKEDYINDELRKCEKYSFYMQIEKKEEVLYKSNIVNITSKDEYNNMIAKQQGYSIEPNQKDFNIYTGYNSIDPLVYENKGYLGTVSLCYCGQQVDAKNIKEIRWFVEDGKSQLWLFDKENAPEVATSEITAEIPYIGFQMFDRYVFDRTAIYCEVTLVNKQKLTMRTFIYSNYIKKDNKDRIISQCLIEKGRYPVFMAGAADNDDELSMTLQLFNTKEQNIFKLSNNNTYYHTQHLTKKNETTYYKKNDEGTFISSGDETDLKQLYQQDDNVKGYISGEPLCIYQSGVANSFMPIIETNLSRFIITENNQLDFKEENIGINNLFNKNIKLKLNNSAVQYFNYNSTDKHLILNYKIDFGWKYNMESFKRQSNDMYPTFHLVNIEEIDVNKTHYYKDSNTYIKMKQINDTNNSINDQSFFLYKVSSDGLTRLMNIAPNLNKYKKNDDGFFYKTNDTSGDIYIIKYNSFYQKLTENDILIMDGSEEYYQPKDINTGFSVDKNFFPYELKPTENLSEDNKINYYKKRVYDIDDNKYFNSISAETATIPSAQYAYCYQKDNETFEITTDNIYNAKKIYYAFQKTENGAYVLNKKIFEKYSENIPEHTGLTHYSKMEYSNANKNYFDKNYIYAEPKEAYIRIAPGYNSKKFLPTKVARPSVITSGSNYEDYYVMVGDRYFKAQGQISSGNIDYFEMSEVNENDTNNIGYLYEQKEYGQPPEAFGLTENLYFFIVGNNRTGFKLNPNKIQFKAENSYSSDVKISKLFVKYGGLYKYFGQYQFGTAVPAPEFERICSGLTNSDVNNYSANLSAVDLLPTQFKNSDDTQQILSYYGTNSYQNLLGGNGILSTLVQNFSVSPSGFSDSASGFIEAATQTANEISHQVESAGYIPRLSASQSDLSDGLNIKNSPFWTKCVMAAWPLPNCTCYAYGRYAEVYAHGKTTNLSAGLAHAAGLSTNNAGKWYRETTGKVKKTVAQFNSDPNKTKYLGAVICWTGGTYGGGGYGHVAIVEKIDNIDGGNIILTVSQSHSSGTLFDTARVSQSNSYRIGSSYQTAGFILQ